jgi:hypothetical protein
MHRTQPGASFHYTKTARLALYFGIAICGLCAIALLAAVAIVAPMTKRPDHWFAIAVVFGIAVYLLLLIRLHVKYWHILEYEYAILKSGISVTYAGQTEFIPWNEMEVAEYMPVPSVFRLSASRLPHPVVLFILSVEGRNTPAAVRNRMAKCYIRDGLSEQLVRRWLPW